MSRLITLIDVGWAANKLPSPIIDLSSTRLGELMVAAGFAVSGPELRSPNGFRGSLDETEAQLKTLTAQRAKAEAALDEALLDDDARATRDAESDARREAANAAPTRKVRGDGSQFDRFPDGRCVEISVEIASVEVTSTS